MGFDISYADVKTASGNIYQTCLYQGVYFRVVEEVERHPQIHSFLKSQMSASISQSVSVGPRKLLVLCG